MARERTNFTKRFGVVFRQAREKAGLSQEELANRSETHVTQVGKMERGQVSPTLDKLVALAEALDMRPSTLISRSER